MHLSYEKEFATPLRKQVKRRTLSGGAALLTDSATLRRRSRTSLTERAVRARRRCVYLLRLVRSSLTIAPPGDVEEGEAVCRCIHFDFSFFWRARVCFSRAALQRAVLDATLRLRCDDTAKSYIVCSNAGRVASSSLSLAAVAQTRLEAANQFSVRNDGAAATRAFVDGAVRFAVCRA